MTSHLKGTFCPKCGGSSDGEGLCGKCRAEGVSWYSCVPKVATVNCPGCGARKISGTWADSEMDRDDIIRETALTGITFHPDVKQRSVKILRMRDVSSNRTRVTLEVSGTLYGESMHAECTLLVAWQKEQCDRCNRITGNYYEGVVQIRAQDRDITKAEIERASQIAQGVEDGLQEGGERLSYISDTQETKDGLDIVIGSQHIGLAIVQAIVQQMGGKYTTHPKLVGEKDGRQLFRITYSLRLPRFQRGDVVRTGRRYAEVIYSDTKQIRIFDLADGTVRNIREEDISGLIGNVRDAEEAMIAYADGDTLGILDPGTGVTTECVAGSRIHAIAGETIRFLRDRDELVLIR